MLLDKLYKIEIRGNLLCIIQSYLESRSQYVCYKLQYQVINLSSGHYFFMVFMNDFSNVSKLFHTILFADDTSVFLEGTEYLKLIETVNYELSKVTIWLNANKLTININKTHYMLFHRSKIKHTRYDILMPGKTLQYVPTTTFLGVISDNKLKWNDHIIYINNEISTLIGITCKMRQYLDCTTLKNLYCTFAFPYIIYCCEIWGDTECSYPDPLIKLQMKCVRAITFSNYLAPSTPIFKNLNTLKFEELVVQRISLMMFKFCMDGVPKPISDLFIVNRFFP